MSCDTGLCSLRMENIVLRVLSVVTVDAFGCGSVGEQETSNQVN